MTNDPTSSPEPFVVNIPNNISRIDIDQYLRDVQDQRRKGLNYSYTTDDDDDEPLEEEPGKNEPWNEVSPTIQRFNRIRSRFQIKHWRSLFDEGNDRDAYYNTVRSLNPQDQSWTTDNVDQIKVGAD